MSDAGPETPDPEAVAFGELLDLTFHLAARRLCAGFMAEAANPETPPERRAELLALLAFTTINPETGEPE